MSFIICHVCKNVVDAEQSSAYFSDNVYKLTCGSCELQACPHCAAKSLCRDQSACMRCNVDKWKSEMRFGGFYYLAVKSRDGMRSPYHLTSPYMFDSHKSTLSHMVEKELRQFLIGIIDPTSAFSLTAAALEKMNSLKEQFDYTQLQRPDFVMHVSPVASNEFEVTLTIVSFPVRINNEF